MTNRQPQTDSSTANLAGTEAPLQPAEIPATLRVRPQWLMWDSLADMPRRPHWAGNFQVSWSDPEEWQDFNDATDTVDGRDSWGLGYVCAADNDDHPTGAIAVIDVDGAADENGRPKDWVPSLEPFLERDAYVEWSPSRYEPGDAGLHIPLAAPDVPTWWSDTHKNDTEHEGIDVLTNKFCTVTGDRLREAGADVVEWGEWVTEWLADAYENLTGETAPPRRSATDDGTATSFGSTSGTGTDSAEHDGDEWLDEELASEALNAIDPDVDYNTWRDIGFALGSHFDTGTAKRLFTNWSRGGSKWDGDAEYLADRIIQDAEEWEYGPATLVKFAQDAGWSPDLDGRGRAPTPSPKELVAKHSEEYDTVDEVPDDLLRADAETDPVQTFVAACERYRLDSGRVGTEQRGDETVTVGVGSILPEESVADAVLSFKRNADLLDGEQKQAVVGHAIRLDLNNHGEFFKTPRDHLYYFYGPEKRVYRVDTDGRRVLTEEFQALVWDRYNLSAGRFSRNLGEDIKSQARRAAPERAVYRLAHYDEAADELYVTDFGEGYYAVTVNGVEWRPNGTDVFFLPTERVEPYEYLEPDERPDLPAEIPGERPLWIGNGDPIMRLFGNRVNYADTAALGPADQRNQLYIHLHTIPFIDVLNARPIMAWVGEKGSGKTVLQRSIGRFIYGADFTESVMPDAKDDFLAKVSNQALAFLDNYDDGVEWANDILAAVATGAGIDQRELYTTNSLRQEVPRCWLSLTSRDPPFRRDDVADRTLVFRVERVDDGFVGMGDYLRQVTVYRDSLWSTYLENLQVILQTYHERDTAAMSSDHRMADWAIFARLIAEALGIADIDELLETMETERATFALENEPWARVLGRWIDKNPATASNWQRAGDLADELEACASEHNLPIAVTSAAGLGSKLATYHSELAELYDLEIDDSGRSNQYRFVTDEGGHDATGLGRYH